MRRKTIIKSCVLGMDKETMNRKLISKGFQGINTEEYLYFMRDTLTEQRIILYRIQKLAYPN